METLESSRVCRLCGKQSGISINIFDKNENHVKKINAVLPIMVHEMDLLPKHMCHRCSYKLEEFHKFYVDCLKTDAGLKSQLSWMRKEERTDEKERIGIPMVHIENIKIKVEPPDYDIYELDPIVENVNYINSMSSVTFPVKSVRTNSIREGIAYAAYASCRYCCDKKDQSNRTVPPNYEKVNGGPVARNNFGNLENVEAVKKNLLVRNEFEDRRSSSSVNKGSKDAERYTIFAGAEEVQSGAKDKSIRKRKVPTSTIVRNLRPRKTSVDYVGTKPKNRVPPSKSPGSNFGIKPKIEQLEEPEDSGRSTFELDSTRIKIERDGDYEDRRILRPRTRTVDYIGHKQKYTKSMDKNQRSVGAEGCGTKRRAVRNIGKESQTLSKKVSKLLAVEDSTKFAIKRELLSDLEESTCLKSVAPKNAKPLPNNVLVDVQNEIRVSSLHRTQYRNRLRVPNELKSLAGSATENSSKTGKLDIRQISAIRFNSKYLRSQYPYLRNGKVKIVHEGEKPSKRLRKNIQSIGKSKMSGEHLMGAIKRTVSTTRNYLDRDIKHYCEKCNISFASKELFKLHECYD